MDVSFSELRNGFCVKFKGKNYGVLFDDDMWGSLPQDFREFFIDNYALLKTIHIPLMFGEKNVRLNRSVPAFRKYFTQMQLTDIPSIYYSQGISPKSFIDKIKNAKFKFENENVKKIWLDRFNEESCVIGFSFGKDSLLTAALADEIGLDTHLFSSEEKGAPIEFKYKEKLSKKLYKELGLKIEKTINETMLMHDFYNFRLKSKYQYILSHLMTEYVFLMLPFAYRHGSKYLFLGNERSCNCYALDKYGNKCYPSFDQSSEWMLEINKMLGSFGNARVGSLVEPLDDLAILKILHKRYPKLAKYQYSCFPDESKNVENERWCCNCSKCARLFIMLKAIGVKNNG